MKNMSPDEINKITGSCSDIFFLSFEQHKMGRIKLNNTNQITSYSFATK